MRPVVYPSDFGAGMAARAVNDRPLRGSDFCRKIPHPFIDRPKRTFILHLPPLDNGGGRYHNYIDNL